MSVWNREIHWSKKYLCYLWVRANALGSVVQRLEKLAFLSRAAVDFSSAPSLQAYLMMPTCFFFFF
jgi:hypothetical protein